MKSLIAWPTGLVSFTIHGSINFASDQALDLLEVRKLYAIDELLFSAHPRGENIWKRKCCAVPLKKRPESEITNRSLTALRAANTFRASCAPTNLRSAGRRGCPPATDALIDKSCCPHITDVNHPVVVRASCRVSPTISETGSPPAVDEDLLTLPC